MAPIGVKDYTRNHERAIPLENAKEHPLEMSSGNPTEKSETPFENTTEKRGCCLEKGHRKCIITLVIMIIMIMVMIMIMIIVILLMILLLLLLLLIIIIIILIILIEVIAKDAACRVIARLLRERDNARAQARHVGESRAHA